MARIYLDLETYRPDEDGAFIDEKIIAAGLLVDRTPYNEKSIERHIPPILYCEWNGFDEKKIISLVERQVEKALKNYRFTVVCGYNILRFDIPLLICKSIHHSKSEPSKVGRFWWEPLTIDLQQQILASNGNMFKGTNLGNVASIAKKLQLNPPDYTESGSSIRELYPEKKFKEIEKHLKQDLKIIRWLDLYGIKRLAAQSVRVKRPLFRDTT